MVFVRAVLLHPIFLLPSTRLGCLSVSIKVRHEQVTCFGCETPPAEVFLPSSDLPSELSFCPQVELSALPRAAHESLLLYFHTSGGGTHTRLTVVPRTVWQHRGHSIVVF